MVTAMSINQANPVVGERLQCSFCGKGQDEVVKLIAGPSVFICDECVGVCIDIIADDHEHAIQQNAESDRWRTRAAALPGNSAMCSVCGKSTPLKAMLPIEGRGVLCGACADAIAQGRPIV
jgi:hypothetical protein